MDTIATNCGSLTRYMTVGYVIDHEQASSLLCQYIVAIL
jgi:hypothetical protein